MKKMTLVMAALLIGLTSVTATTTTKTGKELRVTKRYRYTQPIMFVERGVEFLIFPNGEFDFNTEIVNGPVGNSNFYYRQNQGRRSSINVTFGAPDRHIGFTSPRGTLILHDRFGRVRRIGNVFINYDSHGRIKRAGSVYMRYRRGMLKQVGGLTLRYNRWGELVATHGFVNHNNLGCGICGVSGCSLDHLHDGLAGGSWFNDEHDDWDDDYYYYRRGDKTLKKKKKRTK